MRIRLALLFGLLCCLAMPALAASRSEPAYIRPVVTAPLEGNDALLVTLLPDEALCKKAYGERWIERCSVSPGQHGAPIAGVRLSPETPGEWRWSNGFVLRFTPQKPWPAGKQYSLSLEKLRLSPHTQLTASKVDFATPPLAALETRAGVWVDPGLQGERALSFELTFTTPPDRLALQQNVVIEAGDVRIAAPEFIWSGDGRTCFIKVRILELPASPAPVTLRIPGVASKVERHGTHWIVPVNREGTAVSLLTPGASTLFQVKDARLVASTDASLVGEYRLDIQTSLLVRPDAVADAMKVLLLPRTMQPEAVTPTRWDALPRIDESLLNQANPVRIEPIQNIDQPSDKMTFRVHVPQDSYVFAYLPAGFGPGGYGLERPWHEVFHAEPFKAEVDFLQTGNVLALGGDRKLGLRGSGLTEIRWRATRVLQPFWGFLANQEQPFGAQGAALDALGEAIEGVIPLKRTEPGIPQFAVLDMQPLLKDGRGLMQIELTGYDGKTEKASATRLVLVTDLGMLVKKNADGTRDVFVCSLSEGGPVAGVTVRVLGANGLPVAEALADKEGRATLPSLAGLEREKRPVAVTAQSGADMAWLPLDDGTLAVDYSRFSTQGQISNADGVNAYVFSERGIFRPGETLHFGLIVRRGDWRALPADLPFVAELQDPFEQTVMRRQFTVGADGLMEVAWTAPESAASGVYRLDVRTPDAQGGLILGSGTVRLEEFQPETLSVAATINPTPGKGWLQASQVSADVVVKNLYGTPAVNRRLRGTLLVGPARRLSFPGYERYVFHDAVPYKGAAQHIELPETRTDEQGRAMLSLPLAQLRGGTLDCTLLLEGFEPGEGRAVTAMRRFLISPLGAMLGYRPTGTGGNLDFIPMGSAAALEFVAVGPSLERVDPGELELSVAQRRYVTSLVTDTQGRYLYDEIPADSEILRAKASFKNSDDGASLTWALPTDKPGEFLLTVRDASGRTMALVPFTVAGSDDLRRSQNVSLPSGNLRLHLDQADYAPGDTIKAFFASPFDGLGLLTLERDRVIAHRWFKVKAGNAVQEIVIPEEVEGRVYVNVSMARSLASPDVYMNPHVYAVAPVTVNGRGRDMELNLQVVSAEVRPGGTIDVRLSAARSGRAALFAVDEGVLQLTGFPTPDPLRYLLYDRALEVETRQLFDRVMPDYGRFHIPAFGGDMERIGGKFHNPFKRRGEPPISHWLGLVNVGLGQQQFSFPVPSYYNGTVRIMAVSSSPDATGNAEARALVRGPVTLTPQLPLLAAPGDTFDAVLAVVNTTSAPMELDLSVKASAGLNLAALPSGKLTVEPGAETVLPFRVTVGDVLGNAELTFSVVDSENRITRRTASLSVRPASPLRESLRVGVTDQSVTLHTDRALYPYDAAGSVSVSALPLPALRGLVRYLDAYPYICVEQTLSRAMPYVLLMSRPDLLSVTGRSPTAVRKVARERMDEALQGIQSASWWNGVALWPGAEPDPLVTAYAADFLLAMKDSGLTVPGGVFTSLFNALDNMLNRAPLTMQDARAQAYGLWVMTREGRITAQKLELLEKQLEELFPDRWQKDVTATLLAGSYAVMRMHGSAQRLLTGSLDEVLTTDKDDRLGALGQLALASSVLARQFPDVLPRYLDGLTASMFEEVNDGRYVSLSAALAVRALLDMGSAEKASLAGVSLRCEAMQPGFGTPDARAEMLGDLLTLSVPGCGTYRLAMPESSPQLYWEVSSQGFDRRPPATATAQGLEVTRSYMDAEGQPVTQARQGDVLTVSITVRAHGDAVPDAVIVDLLPGGFEHVLSDVQRTGDRGEGYVRADRREDRMVFYGPLSVEPLTLSYKVRAVNRGTFTLPPVQAEAMYNRTLHANSGADTFVIE